MVRGLLQNRWLRAAAVAVLVAGWPGCAQHDEVPDTAGTAATEAPLDFRLKDMNGNEVHLASFKGRPLIVNFWATWCAPCKQEIPAFIELVEKYKDRKLAVVGISIDDSPEDLRKFATDFRINYPILVGLGHNDIQEAYDAAFAIPVTWFIRPDGSVYLKHPGPASKDWFEKQVQGMLAAAPAQETR